ncbi:hypothetical protein MJO28_011642 [Puccinia striiformis f. sp. tritici]|uniref:Uncharacterized protein n=1 Tax=Puccinia striiformis f. sp. tritici TaxID=168172 RepID=A0ACC0E2N9_9BASI|nr:hypothetical protein MJO29_016735 [Puccinia striiformis f. sp. tritici]KAI7944114.1 hypothetical protein MJO28_011642 [Puccinia striiformis f. sp. tritici]
MAHPLPPVPPNPGLTAAHERMDKDENEVNASRTRLPAIPDTTPPSSAFLTFLAGVLNNPGNRSTSGSVTINSDKLELIQQMIKVEDSRLRKMDRIAQLKTLRLSPAAPPTHPSKPSYARAIGTSNEPRRPQMNPPARNTLQTFKPGKAIIHSNPDHDDVRKLDCGFLVQRANEVLAKLDAQVQGEKITIKAAQVLKSGDVCFFSKNHAQQKWLMENKHQWTKDVHEHLKASPSSFMVIAHGIPKEFDPTTQASIDKITVANNFSAEYLVRMKWLADNSSTSKQAGSVVLAFRNKETAARVEKTGIYLNWDHHRASRFIPRPPQCFKCLEMGRFGQWCREQARCSKCGEAHITKDSPKGLGSIKSCVLCKEGLKLKVKGVLDIDHTPFNVSCFFKKSWLEKKKYYNRQ